MNRQRDFVTHPLLIISMEPMYGTHTHFSESCGGNFRFLTF